jgi:hypothetical protein
VIAGTRVNTMCWMSSNSSMVGGWLAMLGHCIWSSIADKAPLTRKAFLTSSAET